MDQRRPGLPETIITAVLLGALMWWQVPQWQRALIIRQTRNQCYRLLHRLARASGRRAMGDELAGRKAEAEHGYQFTERLSRARDAL